MGRSQRDGIQILLILLMLFFEESQLCLCWNVTDEGCIEEERQALLKFRDNFDNSSRQFLSWGGKQCCQWKGVKCHAITGHVVKIAHLSPKSYSTEQQFIGDSRFSRCSLGDPITYDGSIIFKCPLSSKAISPSLLELKHLNYLDLSFIDFQGSSIPVFLGSMKQLRYLNLSNCFFSGRVPQHLGNLTNLQILDLNNGVDVQGPRYDTSSLHMDHFTWVSHLSSLQYIDMSGIFIKYEINSMIQVIHNLPFLLQAHFMYCRFQSSKNYHGFVNTSSLPSKLQVLNLGWNFLWLVPTALQNMTSLRSLDLSSNALDSVALNLGKFKFLAHLNLAWNEISGLFPIAIQNISSLTFLDLSENSIDSIPLWLGKSKFLAHLNLARNRISGQVPTTIQNMSSLTFLDMSGNYLYSVPLWLGELKFLSHLNLARNELAGSFPTGIQKISSLTFLDLSNNHLTSAVPLWFIKRVQRVILSNNKFSTLESSCPSNTKINCNLNSLGLLPDNKFQEQTFRSFNNTSMFIKNDIQELDLSYNELKDSLESLGPLENMMYLNLASNFFHGPIPLFFRNMKELRALSLEENQLNGSIPAFFGRFSTLRVLNLSGNHLTGIIPDNLGKLQNLKTLDISSNCLIGVIPDNLGKVQNLTTLDLSNNYLMGVIPTHFGKLRNLIILDLSNNSLEGTIKEIHLDNLSYLRYLRIGNNKLSMKLAPKWLPPFQLVHLQLQSCKIGTPFPQWLQSQKQLENLYLSDTGIWGTLPTWFQQEYLRVLDLSNNKISGQLPTNLHDMMPYLNSMFLGNNLMNGSIPKSLCKLKYLVDIDLSKNKFSSEIPSCLGEEIDAIALIDLSSNELSGTIPESFCSSHCSYSLQSMNLSNNSLHGELPSTLQSCNSLEILDLGNNELYGIIPSSIWNDTSVLKILRLRQNKFSGTIPLSLCQLSVLRSLDLASNKLIGTIPSCLGHLKGMILNLTLDKGSMRFLAPNTTAPAPDFDRWDEEHVKQVLKGTELDFTKNLKFVVNLDLSNNSLVGFIPEVITSLTKLVGLNLSHNYLLGEIPSKIGKIKMLESLDLSWNQLTGQLPSSMSSLTLLSRLNLSYNNFSGPIPEGTQFSTFEDPFIYAGNQYLCGEPMLKKCHNNDNNEDPTSVHHEDKNEKEKIMFYFVVAIGFMTGFWGIIALLLSNKRLRYACFRYMEKIADEMYVAVAIRVTRLKRMGLKRW